MIELKGITKDYMMWWNVINVLKWVDLKINTGDFVSIMWPSWSGKSTLMNIIGMLDVATTWRYSFDDIIISGKKEDDLASIRGEKIWFIFQSYNLISRMSVIKQVMLPLGYQWLPKKIRYERALEALKKVWLEDKKDNKPNELSGWQQQRVSIARALAVKPSMILADEPTWALDSKTGEEIMNLLTKLNKEWTTIVLITHESNIDEYASKHINIKDGVII